MITFSTTCDSHQNTYIVTISHKIINNIELNFAVCTFSDAYVHAITYDDI